MFMIALIPTHKYAARTISVHPLGALYFVSILTKLSLWLAPLLCKADMEAVHSHEHTCFEGDDIYTT